MQAKDEKRFAVAAGTPASLIKPQMTGCKAAQIMLVSAMEVVARKEQGVLERRGNREVCNAVYDPVLCFHNTFCGLHFNAVWEPGYLRVGPRAGENMGKFLANYLPVAHDFTKGLELTRDLGVYFVEGAGHSFSTNSSLSPRFACGEEQEKWILAN